MKRKPSSFHLTFQIQLVASMMWAVLKSLMTRTMIVNFLSLDASQATRKCVCALVPQCVVRSLYLHRAAAEELLDVFSHTGCGHALGVRATDVPVGKSEEETGLERKCWLLSPTPFLFNIYLYIISSEVTSLTVRSPGRRPAPPAAVPPPPAQPTNPGHTPCAGWTSHWPPEPPVAFVQVNNYCESFHHDVQMP